MDSDVDIFWTISPPFSIVGLTGETRFRGEWVIFRIRGGGGEGQWIG
jgi:hypothetical protein